MSQSGDEGPPEGFKTKGQMNIRPDESDEPAAPPEGFETAQES